MIQTAAILLVEDDENDVLLMRRALQRARLANPLHVVTDGDDAIAYLSGKREFADRDMFPVPLLVLLDLKLPTRSGFEVIEWIRRQSDLRDLPVVVLTSSTEQPDVRKAYSLGANSYLVKPAHFEDLVQMMLRLEGYWLLLNRKSDRMAVVMDE